MSSPVVVARGLHQAYGRHAALRGIDLTIASGEAIALLGPNGAGKSTLLRILSTLERPQRGELAYAADEPRRTIGLVAHESLCYADLSARENLVFFGGLYDVADPEARATDLLDRVALTSAADRPARTYSRGMLQRLAIARALVHAPRLLLLDEPFTGLDRQGCALIGALLADEKARGASVLVVSHDLPSVAALVDRAVVIAKGRVLADQAITGDALTTLARLYDDLAPATA